MKWSNSTALYKILQHVKIPWLKLKVLLSKSTYVKVGVSPLVKLKLGFIEGSNVGATGWAAVCVGGCVWPKLKLAVGLVKFCTVDPVVWLAEKPNKFEVGCELLEPKLYVVVLAADVVVAGLLLPGLLVPNIGAAVPNTGPLAGIVVPNDGISELDVTTALDPKAKAGPT